MIPDKKPKACEIKNGIILKKDSDGDGLPDINLDIDNDCFAELNIDLNKDGIPDLDIDSNGDGKPDINVDVNGDGHANLNLLKLSAWTPNKDDCVVDGFHYDTMSGLKPDSNIDSDGDGKADTNITDKDGNPIDTSVKANYNSSSTQGVGGAGTGDSTKWFLWALCMILTLCTMCIHVYRSHKR